MTETPSRKQSAAEAPRELRQLQEQTEAVRALLARLQQEVSDAEKRLASGEAGPLVEANEQLVLANMRMQTGADVTAKALEEMSRAAELDPLTELPNRLLMRAMHQAAKRCAC